MLNSGAEFGVGEELVNAPLKFNMEPEKWWIFQDRNLLFPGADF